MADDADELRTYRLKRDPGATNEPFEVAKPTSGETWGGDFVVHLHAATRRHYDLRLQVGSVLKSFAVPRGPALDPAEKRLAVQTEDHPLSYLDFEDVIPDGLYGAGPMIAWDIGRVRYLENSAESGLPKGKLDFELYGRKLRGRFALVETTGRVAPKPKQRQWLLLKKQDPFCEAGADAWVEARPASVLSGLRVEQLAERAQLEAVLLAKAEALGAKVGRHELGPMVPMLCAPGGVGLTDPARVYELKLDGVRILAERSAAQVRLKYRKPQAFTQSYPEIARALATLFATEFLIDGEILTLDAAGRPSFPALAPRIAALKPHDIKQAMALLPVTYVVFDLLRLGPYDLTALPLIERKRLLSDLVPGDGLVRYLPHLEQNGQALFTLAEQQGLEGVVSKVARAAYRFGPERSLTWVKHKCRRYAQFVVVGWIAGKGSRSLGALELAFWRASSEPSVGHFAYAGRVGGGLSDAALRELSKRLAALEVDACPLQGEVPEVSRGRRWVRPELVVEIEYLEWTPQGHLRMPIFRKLVAGVEPHSCLFGPPSDPLAPNTADPRDEGPNSAPAEAASEALGARANAPRAERLPARKVQLTNLEKVFWPEEGYTKGEMLDYYARISPALLPHLRDRPIMLVRYPDGITGKNFYQWNVPVGTPDWIACLELRHEERDGKQISTFLVDDLDSLLHVVNLGCIPLHVLACRQQSLEHCEFLTIDFDLGGRPFSDAVQLGLGLRELLLEVGLQGFPKTSGQTGLHVFIPLGQGVPFAAAKMLNELIGVQLQRRFRELSTVERRISERKGRVYIDTGQTGRSRTIVAPYSVRAYPGATVSTPLHWEELHLALRPSAFTMFSVPERTSEIGDPMAEMYDAAPNVVEAVARLEKLMRGAQ